MADRPVPSRRPLAFRRPLALVAVAAAVVLAGCGAASSGGSSGSQSGSQPSSATAGATGTPASGPHDDADVAFATGMVPHHQQAVQMSQVAADRASSTEVRSLAARIAGEQAPKIAQMSGWLAGWGETVPAADASMTSMGSGMMSEDDMNSLAAASGAAFDRMWVSMMIEHHTGALEMAGTEQRDGENPDAQALAASIVSSQQAEIDGMQTLLQTLPTS